jgi:hypothetical protein
MVVTISEDPVPFSPLGALSIILLEAGPAAIPKAIPIRKRPARRGMIPDSGDRTAKIALKMTKSPQAATAKTRRPCRSDHCPKGMLRIAIIAGGISR